MARGRLMAAALVAAALLAGCQATQSATPAPEDREEQVVEVVEPEAKAAPEPEAEPESEPEPAAPAFDNTGAVTTTTSEGGLTVTAPEGFLDTPEYAAVEAALQELLDRGASVGLVLTDLDTGKGFSYNADERFYPASSIKALYCTMLVENGAGVSDTMADCLVNSSNDAYEELVKAYGMPAFGSWLGEHGATEAAYDGSIWYYPRISAGELAAAWQEVYRFCTSDEPGASQLADLLSQTWSTPMGDLLREDCTVWSKAGWFPATEDNLSASVDAGAVDSDAGAYVLVVMTDLPSNLAALTPLIEALDAAHTAF